MDKKSTITTYILHFYLQLISNLSNIYSVNRIRQNRHDNRLLSVFFFFLVVVKMPLFGAPTLVLLRVKFFSDTCHKCNQEVELTSRHLPPVYSAALKKIDVEISRKKCGFENTLFAHIYNRHILTHFYVLSPIQT